MTRDPSRKSLMSHRDSHKAENLAALGQKDQVAVALRYDKDSDDAPILSAKGQGAIAEQILQVAFANGIRVRRDADLAEILMAVDVESEIPLEAFAAVAEILNYIYRLNRIYGPDTGARHIDNDHITPTPPDSSNREYDNER
ncbi:MAG: EscU/YscU/HrcU family type III secretion system export apparatus switch protein [Pseudomonadota bacterium]